MYSLVSFDEYGPPPGNSLAAGAASSTAGGMYKVFAVNVWRFPGSPITDRAVNSPAPLADAAVLGEKLWGFPGSAITDNAVICAIHHTSVKESPSTGAVVMAVKVNLPPATAVPVTLVLCLRSAAVVVSSLKINCVPLN